MVKVETFLRNKKGQLIKFDQFKDKIKDMNYIEGSIELSVNDVCLVGRSTWDYIDQLWAYICQGIEKVRNGETFKTNYPDQPIKLVFKPLPAGMLLVTCTIHEKVSVVVEKKLFIEQMSHAAEQFSRFMADRYPKHREEFLFPLHHVGIES